MSDAVGRVGLVYGDVFKGRLVQRWAAFPFLLSLVLAIYLTLDLHSCSQGSLYYS